MRIERLITDYSNMLKGEALEAKLQLTRFDLIKLLKKLQTNISRLLIILKNISIEINNLIKKKLLLLVLKAELNKLFRIY